VEDNVLDALAVQLDLDLVPLDVPVAHGGEPADAQPALRPAVRLAVDEGAALGGGDTAMLLVRQPAQPHHVVVRGLAGFDLREPPSPHDSASVLRRPQKSSSSHVAGFGPMRPRSGSVRFSTQRGSPICGVGGTQTSEPVPACGGASRRTNETYDALTGRSSAGIGSPSWLWLRARSASRPELVAEKPRDSRWFTRAGSARPAAVTPAISAGQKRASSLCVGRSPCRRTRFHV